jgi:hypothetical protein
MWWQQDTFLLSPEIEPRFYFTHTQGTDKCTLPEYVSTYIINHIINHLHVSVASVIIIRVLYRNTDKILTTANLQK